MGRSKNFEYFIEHNSAECFIGCLSSIKHSTADSANGYKQATSSLEQDGDPNHCTGKHNQNY